MWSIQQVVATGSTNADVADAARAGAAEGLAIVADHQQAGRGRLDRSWHTPAGTALTVSFLLRPADVPTARWPWLPLVTGIAVVDAVAMVADGVSAGLKWPNDVVVKGDKLAGILLERVATAHGPAAVIGVGLNVAQMPRGEPDGDGTVTAGELMEGAVSLRSAGSDANRDTVLGAVAAQLSDRYQHWRSAKGDPVATGLLEDYRRRSVTLGQWVRAILPDGHDLVGTAHDIDDAGRLVIAPDDPTLDNDGRPSPADDSGIAIGAGDIVHLRPA